MSEMQDIKIRCGCGDQFTWTVNDQKYYAERGFQKPKRCKKCRPQKKAFFDKDEDRNNTSRDHLRENGYD